MQHQPQSIIPFSLHVPYQGGAQGTEVWDTTTVLIQPMDQAVKLEHIFNDFDFGTVTPVGCKDWTEESDRAAIFAPEILQKVFFVSPHQERFTPSVLARIFQ